MLFKLYSTSKQVIFEKEIKETSFKIMKFIKMAIKEGVDPFDICARSTIDEINKLPKFQIKSVLAMDDEEVIQKAYLAFLERLGHYVEVATDADEGLRKMSSNPKLYDVIFADNLMPSKSVNGSNMRGSEFATHAYGINPDVDVSIVTGDTASVGQEIYDFPNVKANISKPIDLWTFYSLGKGRLPEKTVSTEKKVA